MKALLVVAATAALLAGASARADADKDKKDKNDDAPVLYTNEDLPQPPAGAAPSQAARPAPPTTEPAPPLEISSYDAILDQDGHGEGWWRQLACELDAAIVLAEDEAQRLHVAYMKMRRLAMVDATLPARLVEAAARVRELKAERDGLPEELRRAGGLPGWLRGGGPCLESETLPAPETEPTIHGKGITLSWKPVPGGSFYVLELQCLDCCGMLGACDVRTMDVRGTTTEIPFEAGRSGRFRVRALQGGGAGGEWSEWQSFKHP